MNIEQESELAHLRARVACGREFVIHRGRAYEVVDGIAQGLTDGLVSDMIHVREFIPGADA